MAKRTSRPKSGKIIRQNRPGWKKKVTGRKDAIKFRKRGTKIKSKEWETVDQ